METPTQCPQCRAPFADPFAAQVVCQQCDGVWLSFDALATLMAECFGENANFELVEQPWGGGVRACAVCAATMDEVWLTGVPLDRCAAHGFWFDRDELHTAMSRTAELPARPVQPTAPAMPAWRPPAPDPYFEQGTYDPKLSKDWERTKRRVVGGLLGGLFKILLR